MVAPSLCLGHGVGGIERLHRSQAGGHFYHLQYSDETTGQDASKVSSEIQLFHQTVQHGCPRNGAPSLLVLGGLLDSILLQDFGSGCGSLCGALLLERPSLARFCHLYDDFRNALSHPRFCECHHLFPAQDPTPPTGKGTQRRNHLASLLGHLASAGRQEATAASPGASLRHVVQRQPSSREAPAKGIAHGNVRWHYSKFSAASKHR
mmetsp:Transcript_14844/g.32349  ORF Transcript_14844/g.32349 Transcript_14844/m.32349 type:complete len:207 (-) Transcript_14844:648-1268(-)